jgi:hypothetical protein
VVRSKDNAECDLCDPHDHKKQSPSEDANFVPDQNDVNISTNTVGRNSKNDDDLSPDRSHRSYRSHGIEKQPDKQEDQRINQLTYRLGRSDKFRYNYRQCKLSGDKCEILYKHFHEEKPSK